ncbi:cytochrome b [Burkholderia cenocepacia]|uniref:cytochrome b n=1 Tax=Burkholderia cenocepacia TaxID=95486 RepID=UPI00076CFFF2|nr:hypothetical protein AS149_14635 [Burkholderia cenocepacia]
MQKNASYSPAARSLHWLVGGLILVTLVIGWVWPTIAPGPDRQLFSNIHKLFGSAALFMVLLRIVVRLRRRPPDSSPFPRWQRMSSTAVHRLLYGLMLAMPLSGLATLNWRSGVAIFGIRLPQWTPEAVTRLLDSPADVFQWTHYAGAWIISIFICLHIVAALWHQFVKRDGVMSRMLPPASETRTNLWHRRDN